MTCTVSTKANAVPYLLFIFFFRRESDSSVTATPVRVDSGTTGTLTGLQSLSSYVVSITAFDFVGQMSLPFGNLVVQTSKI